MTVPLLPGRRMTRQERSAHNRATLLQAAWEYFVERGYDGVTVEEVAERAGFSRVTAYTMFGSKAGMFCELMLDRVKGASPADIAPMGSPMATVLREALPVLRDRLDDPESKRMTELIDLALGLMRRDDALMQRYRHVFREQTDRATANLMEFCRASGQDHPDAPRDVVLLMAALNIGMLRLADLDPESVTAELWLRGHSALLGT